MAIMLICFVCVLGTFGGILLAQSLKASLIFKTGLEQAQKTMFAVGAGAVALAVLLSLLGLLLPSPF